VIVRFITYLAPSLPAALFEDIVDQVAESTGLATALRFETSASGPRPDERDPFTAGDVDIGFVCAPTYRWLADRRPPPVTLLGVAPRFDDPRTAGRPVYFSEVVVGAGHAARSFADLRGAVWGYNDECSLSGYLSLLAKLDGMGVDPSYLAELRRVGSHLEALSQVARGELDAACIDSNVLALARRRDPALGRALRVVETWGPFPIQPVVARVGLDAAVRDRVRMALLGVGERLVAHGLVGFAPVGEDDYAG
jgi:ABC-type phosphate/phosphonate transport system substrate-binding protein